jgi:hypothetical protein
VEVKLEHSHTREAIHERLARDPRISYLCEPVGRTPRSFPDEDLVTHLTRCRNHHTAMISQHMRFTAAALVPRHGHSQPSLRLGQSRLYRNNRS